MLSEATRARFEKVAQMKRDAERKTVNYVREHNCIPPAITIVKTYIWISTRNGVARYVARNERMGGASELFIEVENGRFLRGPSIV